MIQVSWLRKKSQNDNNIKKVEIYQVKINFFIFNILCLLFILFYLIFFDINQSDKYIFIS